MDGKMRTLAPPRLNFFFLPVVINAEKVSVINIEEANLNFPMETITIAKPTI
jgi:hypothetical protein